jgi:alanine-synthesizing transaminase
MAPKQGESWRSETMRFSSRLPWHLPCNALSAALHDRQSGTFPPLLDLTVSNPTRALPELYSPALLLGLGDERGLHYAPTAQGASEARQAVAAAYAAVASPQAVALDPKQLVLCASTSEGYSWLFQLLCNPSDSVLFPQPSYPLLEFLAGLASVQLQPYFLHYDGRWHLDLAGIAHACEAAQPKPRALILVNPNNPTGSFVHERELSALLQLCQKHNLALIVDEVFADYGFAEGSPFVPAAEPADPRVSSLLSQQAAIAQAGVLCFVLSGLSKVLGLPQLKLGWIHVGGAEPLRTAAQDRLELIADTFLSVGTPIQLATPQLLSHKATLQAGIMRRVTDNLQTLQTLTAQTAVQLLPVEGGWYAVLRLPALLSEEAWVLTLLQQDHILVHPGYFFDFAQEAYVVLSLLCDPKTLATGLTRLLSRVQQVISDG